MPTIFERYGATLRMYDAGDKFADRFTLIPPRWAGPEYRERDGAWLCFSAGPDPFHPQGFGQHSSATPGPHLGKRLKWGDLPRDVQRCARLTFPDFCPLEAPRP